MRKVSCDCGSPGDLGTWLRSRDSSASAARACSGQPAFAGFDLVEPGLVQVPMWRPDHKALRASELAKIGR